jgi:hypothetical protein
MEGHPVLMSQQNRCCKNGCTPESNPYVNAIPIKIPETLFTDIENESSKTQSNPESKEQGWRSHNT